MTRYRLVTKADFDGMACGILFKELDLIDSVAFTHPNDLKSGRFKVTGTDITAGFGDRKEAHLSFDHGADHPEAASTARGVFEHYGKHRFRERHAELLDAVDKGLSGRLTTDEILYPSGWVLLNYLIDHRTGLERFGRFSKSHTGLLDELMAEGRTHTIWELLSLPDMEERLELYFSGVEEHKAQVLRCASVYSNLVVIDTRRETTLYPGNRFIPYALFPECNLSLHISRAPDGLTAFSAGRSVLDRTAALDLGALMRGLGGGGYPGAAAVQVPEGRAEDTQTALIEKLQYGFMKNLYMGYFNYY